MNFKFLKYSYITAALCLALAGCTTTPQKPAGEAVADKITFKQENFSVLPNWTADNFQNFSNAYSKSCARILKKDSQSNFGSDEIFGKYQSWKIACRKFENINVNNAGSVRQFFEQNFTPYSVKNNNQAEGLFTGYYEASLNGSRQKSDKYNVPLRARPDDLVMVDLGAFRDELKGQRIAGRVKDGNLKPYETHDQIIKGGLPAAQDKPLVWVDNAVDAFFLQIQGSGIVALDDGTTMRVGYAGQNGHPYTAVGKELITRGELTKDNVSMQTIRNWMATHPDQAADLMTVNKSYVFFTEIKGEGPLGGEGVALTAERSLAIDRSLIAYGVPVWLDVQNPAGGQITKLMMAQDTGGAIRGPVRGDYFWGYGAAAENMAGIMKSKGRYWFLIPKPSL